MDDFEYVDIEDHFARMVAATELLNKLTSDARSMRFQFGEKVEQFNNLVDAINDAQNSWIASNC